MGGQATLQAWREGPGRNRALPGSASPRAPSLDQSWTAGHPVRRALPGRLPAPASPRSRVKLAGSRLECQGCTGPRPSQPGLRRLTIELPGCEAPCSGLIRTNPGELGRVRPRPRCCRRGPWTCCASAPCPRGPGSQARLALTLLRPPGLPSRVLLQPLWRGTHGTGLGPGVGPFPGRPGHRPLCGGC